MLSTENAEFYWGSNPRWSTKKYSLAFWRGEYFFLVAPGESKFIPGRGNPRWSTKNIPIPRPFGRGVRKTVNGAHLCGCAPFLYAIMTYGTVAAAPLALPQGELSPKVTERALQAFLNGDIKKIP